MRVRELLEHIDGFAPFDLAEDWDNPGLISGSFDEEITKIAVCLDATSRAVIEAEARGCNVLVTHHPLIFRPVKSINDNSEQGRTLIEAIRRDVNIIAAHTNWDKAPGGVNDTLAHLLGLNDIEALGDFGVIGELKRAMKPEVFAKHVKSSWNLTHIEIYGECKRVKNVALCGGSGAEFWRKALSMKAEVYLTADMKYHELADAVNEGLMIGLIDHGEMERASIPELARRISECGAETVIIDVRALPSPTILQ